MPMTGKDLPPTVRERLQRDPIMDSWGISQHLGQENEKSAEETRDQPPVERRN